MIFRTFRSLVSYWVLTFLVRGEQHIGAACVYMRLFPFYFKACRILCRIPEGPYILDSPGLKKIIFRRSNELQTVF